MTKTATAIPFLALLLPMSGLAAENDRCSNELATIEDRAAKLWLMTKAGDFVSAIPFTNEKLIELSGGKEKYLQLAKERAAILKNAGLQFESIKPTSISRTYRGGPYYVCFLSADFVFVKDARRSLVSGYFVAARKANSPWTFIDGSGVSKNPKSLQVFFPGLPANIALPAIDLGNPL